MAKGKFINLENKRFGLLIVICREKNKNNAPTWRCKCDCGKETIVSGGNLRRGNTKSCGCYNITSHIKHGLSNEKLYGVWGDLKTRTLNINSQDYKNYGGRGIKVCKKWENFEPFYNWAIDNGYKVGLTIDRIDNNKGYSPENCRWVTYNEQANNKRNNHLITYKDKTLTMSQWANKIGISRHTLFWRLNNGWSLEKALEN